MGKHMTTAAERTELMLAIEEPPTPTVRVLRDTSPRPMPKLRKPNKYAMCRCGSREPWANCCGRKAQ
jgi:hypothetical protein